RARRGSGPRRAHHARPGHRLPRRRLRSGGGPPRDRGRGAPGGRDERGRGHPPPPGEPAASGGLRRARPRPPPSPAAAPADLRAAHEPDRPRLPAEQRPLARLTVMPASSAVLEMLVHGHLDVKGRLPWSSNLTFLVELAHEGASSLGVYKPGRGERP